LIGTRSIVEYAQNNGYDGLIVKNVKDNYHNTQSTKPGTVYTVFSSYQIKSATNNNGNFDGNIKNINEYRHQLEIPFDNKHPLHDKPFHVHILDALLDMDNNNNVKEDDYYSDWINSDISNAWENNKIGAFEQFRNNIFSSDDMEVNYVFLNSYNPIDTPEYFNNEIALYIKEKELENIQIDTEDVIDSFDLYDNLYNYLSNKGQRAFEDYAIEELFNNKIDEYGCQWTLERNLTDTGLVPLYRAIKYDKGRNDDLYQNIMYYKCVGIYWTFDYDSAIPHGAGAGKTVILSAYVKPEYINWKQTIFKSAWDLNDEKEVELLYDKDIMIWGISIENKDYRKKNYELKLPKPFIVKT